MKRATKKHSKPASAPRKTANSNVKTTRTTKADDRFAQQIYRRIMRSPALLKDVDRAERTAQLRDWVRRATWHFMAMSGKEIISRCRKDRDFAIALALMQEHTRPYVTNLKQIIAFVEGIDARILVALACREDMSDVIAEAKRVDQGSESITIDNVHELLRNREASKATTPRVH